MIAAIHQPHYLPWMGYIDKMDKADVFCILDNVQYKKNEWQNRNRLKAAGGWQWITVPVSYRFPETINAVKINNSANWRRKHLQALVTNYGKAPFFDDYIEIFRQVYAEHWQYLSELNIQLMECIRMALDLAHKPIVRASQMQLSDDPNDRLIDICQALDCDTYLAGAAGEGYMDLERFQRRGLRVVFQDFKHPAYPQLFGDFISHLSIVDMLFNCGPDSLRRIRAANPRAVADR